MTHYATAAMGFFLGVHVMSKSLAVRWNPITSSHNRKKIACGWCCNINNSVILWNRFYHVLTLVYDFLKWDQADSHMP